MKENSEHSAVWGAPGRGGVEVPEPDFPACHSGGAVDSLGFLRPLARESLSWSLAEEGFPVTRAVAGFALSLLPAPVELQAIVLNVKRSPR